MAIPAWNLRDESEYSGGSAHGDRAVLARIDGNANGLVFFIDGDKACTPMLLPHELLGILRDVETGKIAHETAGLALATPAGAAGAHSGA
jgi:hypothetical protein